MTRAGGAVGRGGGEILEGSGYAQGYVISDTQYSKIVSIVNFNLQICL